MLILSSKVHATQSIFIGTHTTEADKSAVRKAFEAYYSKRKALKRKITVTIIEVTFLG